MEYENKRKLLLDLLKTQKFAVIATLDKKEPYTNLVSFLCINDLKNIVFSTSRYTKKYQNIIKNPRISMLVDNRDNTASDIQNAIVITAIGSAEEIKENVNFYKKNFLLKHPYLSDFVNSSDSALINICIDRYIIVNKFENVQIIEI